MPRTRSPNYPAMSLPEAIETVRGVYEKSHRARMEKIAVAKAMGHSSLNGASLTKISALDKYGLLDHVGDEYQVSQDAVTILKSPDKTERQAALRRAALAPALFDDLAEKYDVTPDEEIIRSYLESKLKFKPNAAALAARNYRETMELVTRDGNGYDAAEDGVPQEEVRGSEVGRKERHDPFEFWPGPVGGKVMKTQQESPAQAPAGVFQMTLENDNSLEVRLSRKLTPEEFDALFNENLFPFLRMSLVRKPRPD